MIPILEFVWWLSLVLLMGYHLILFRVRRKRSSRQEHAELPGVSIIIAVRNGSEALIQNLDVICSQDYPSYEVIIVDDHSTAHERQQLEAIRSRFTRVSLYHTDPHQGKKYALSLGIEMAKYNHILCTDADCRPTSPHWIKRMMDYSSGDNIVLGYSPYLRTHGMLNRIIRFETVMTGMQYLSWAMIGRPYMGVGRNMLYPRSLIQKLDPYKAPQRIPYGDDDLWIQQAGLSTPVNVCLEKSSHVFSTPSASWSQWLRQKHRHMSAGHHYTAAAWWPPGVYAMSLIYHWAMFPVLLFIAYDISTVIYFVAGLAVRWYGYTQWTIRLGDKDTRIWYPMLEMMYAIYLAVMGVYTTFVKRKAWN